MTDSAKITFRNLMEACERFSWPALLFLAVAGGMAPAIAVAFVLVVLTQANLEKSR
jgi:hypothetical protein